MEKAKAEKVRVKVKGKANNVPIGERVMEMKKIFFAVVIILAFAVEAFSASSVVWTSYRWSQGGSDMIEVVATYTCHTDGTFTTIAFYEDEVAEAAGNTLDLRGYYLYQIVHDVGGTGILDNSDLEVLEHTSTGRDILGGAGTNFLDNADTTPLANIAPWRNGVDAAMPIFSKITYLKISNNNVNGATGALIFKFIR